MRAVVGTTRLCRASSMWWISLPSGTASGISTGQTARGRRDLYRSALPAWPRRRAARFSRPRLRIPVVEVRGGLGTERRRILYADRSRLPDGAHHAPEARRGMPRLCVRVGGPAREAPARRARARSDQQGSAEALRPGTNGRELRRRADERDHPRHGVSRSRAATR